MKALLTLLLLPHLAAVVPGFAGTFDFPDLPPDLHGGIARVGVSVPEGAGPFPLLLWFGGGKGTNEPQNAPPLVDRTRWIVAALPTRGDVQRPLHAMHARKIGPHWDYHQPMIERIFRELPAIDRTRVVAAGMSNGAHLVASYLAQGRPGFVENVRAFVIVEGSCAENSPAAKMRGVPIYLAWGADEGGSMGLMQNMVTIARDAGMDLTTRTMVDVGHAFPGLEIERARRWIDRKIPPMGGAAAAP